MKYRKIIWLVSAIILTACNMGLTPVPTEDPGAIQTQAFGIVLTQAASQQTQTAQAIPPTALPTNTPLPTAALPTFASVGGTNTPFAFNTQQPGLTPLAAATSAVATVPGAYSTITTEKGCNNAWLISESEPVDGTSIRRGTEFTKSWELLNTGTCTWDEGYSFSFRPEYSTSPEGASVGYYNKDEVLTKASSFTKPGQTRTFTVQLKAPSKIGEYVWSWKLKDDAGNLFGSLVFIKFISIDN